jgi:hypothetical protein
VGVHHDSIKPARKWKRFVVAMEEPKSPDERLLNQILGVGAVSGQPQGDMKSLPMRLLEKLLKELLPTAGSLDP